MKTWYIGFNDWWFTASIHLVEVPVILHFLEQVVFFICSIIPSIPLPKIKFKLKDERGYEFTKNNDGWTDLNEWFGELDQLWHFFLCMPVSHLVYKHTKCTIIDVPFEFAIQMFPKEHLDVGSEYDDEENLERLKHRKIANELFEQYAEVYGKLNFEYIKKIKEQGKEN